MNKKQQIEFANSFAALGHQSRIAIFLKLLTRANSGVHFGELKVACDIPASTLGHHLNELERGGIIERIPEGRTTLFRPRLSHLNKMLTTMMTHCCFAEGEETS